MLVDTSARRGGRDQGEPASARGPGRRGAGLPPGRARGPGRAGRRRACASTSSISTRPTTATSTSRCSSRSDAPRLLEPDGLVVAEHFHKRAAPGDNRGPRPARARSGWAIIDSASTGARTRRRPRSRGEAGANRRRDAPPSIPGSFDPITNGHLDIIERGLSVFDEVMIAILVNPEKRPLFTVEERVADHPRGLPAATARAGRHLLGPARGLRGAGAGATVIVRGLRAISDFEYEFQMALMNRRLEPEDRDGLHDAGRELLLSLVAAGEGGVPARRPRRATSCRRRWRSGSRRSTGAPEAGRSGGKRVTKTGAVHALAPRPPHRGLAHGGHGRSGPPPSRAGRAGPRLQRRRARPGDAAAHRGRGEVAALEAGQTRYTPSAGLPELRAAVAASLPAGLRGRLRARRGRDHDRRQARALPRVPGPARPRRRGDRPLAPLADLHGGGAAGRRPAGARARAARRTASRSPPAWSPRRVSPRTQARHREQPRQSDGGGHRRPTTCWRSADWRSAGGSPCSTTTPTRASSSSRPARRGAAGAARSAGRPARDPRHRLQDLLHDRMAHRLDARAEARWSTPAPPSSRTARSARPPSPRRAPCAALTGPAGVRARAARPSTAAAATSSTRRSARSPA